MWVAAVGIAVNAGTAAMFMAGSKSDLNIRGAFLHMAADAAIALGVVVAAFIMSRTGWLWLDPAVSFGICVLIAVGTSGLFRESLNLALDTVPAGVDRAAVEAFLSSAAGVVAVHDLHIWSLSTDLGGFDGPPGRSQRQLSTTTGYKGSVRPCIRNLASITPRSRLSGRAAAVTSPKSTGFYPWRHKSGIRGARRAEAIWSSRSLASAASRRFPQTRSPAARMRQHAPEALSEAFRSTPSRFART